MSCTRLGASGTEPPRASSSSCSKWRLLTFAPPAASGARVAARNTYRSATAVPRRRLARLGAAFLPGPALRPAQLVHDAIEFRLSTRPGFPGTVLNDRLGAFLRIRCHSTEWRLTARQQPFRNSERQCELERISRSLGNTISALERRRRAVRHAIGAEIRRYQSQRDE